MTDALTAIALVGSARSRETATGEPLADAVLGGLPELSRERRVLLAAGARAVVRMAAGRPATAPALPAACPAETRPACSPRAARLVAELLARVNQALLIEALELCARARIRLPHALLVDALRLGDARLRAAARPVLGERGLWLGRLNSAWSWAARETEADTIEALEPRWQEGSPPERRDALVRARRIDAARARAWVEAVWSTEKADHRTALLALLGTGLGPSDEPLLERALDDRAAGVREAAQALLVRLPSSALVARMTARADAMVDLDRARQRSVLSFLGRRPLFTVSPPHAVDAAAERDGLSARPPPGIGPRAFWLSRALAAVPVVHWTERFALSPGELVEAAAAGEWAVPLCDGWQQAMSRTPDEKWMSALWSFWERCDAQVASEDVASRMLQALLRAMTPAQAMARVERLLDQPNARLSPTVALALVPPPWSARLGHRWLRAVYHHRPSETGYSDPLLPTVAMAALALPRECYAAALQPFPVAEHPWWRRPLGELADVIAVRRSLAEEIVP